MKPILHIVKKPDDKQAVDIIATQAKDNAYGVAVVFIQDAVTSPPLDGARSCALANGAQKSDNINKAHPDLEIIGYDDLIKLIFSVESITVW